jgi:hypothetical protein
MTLESIFTDGLLLISMTVGPEFLAKGKILTPVLGWLERIVGPAPLLPIALPVALTELERTFCHKETGRGKAKIIW